MALALFNDFLYLILIIVYAFVEVNYLVLFSLL